MGSPTNYEPDLEQNSKIRDRISTSDIEGILGQVIQRLNGSTGYDFIRYKPTTLLRCIKKRMETAKIIKASAYLTLLESHPKEIEFLVSSILNGVSRFFGDDRVNAKLRETIIPNMFQEKLETDTVRIWVIGCSTGEEVYTLAILCREYLDSKGIATEVRIFGTDINPSAIDQARRGSYSNKITSHLRTEHLSRYFNKSHDTYKVVNSIRNMCIFSLHDINKNPPFTKINLLSCRNLLTYFPYDLQNQALDIFYSSIIEGGLLVLGETEYIPDTEKFQSLFPNVNIFERKTFGTPKSEIHDQLDHQTTAHRVPNQTRLSERLSVNLASSVNHIEKIILSVASHPSVVINRSYQVLYLVGNFDKYIKLRPGAPQNKLLNLLRKPYNLHIRTAIEKAIKSGHHCDTYNTTLQGTAFEIQVRKIPQTQGMEALYLITFPQSELASEQSASLNQESFKQESTRIEFLERELKTVEDLLHTSIEDSESIHDQLRASYEDLVSQNEELQASNEELHTTQDDLVDRKHQLEITNDKLKKKIRELEKTNCNLDHLVSSIQIPTLLLDRDLNLMSFTPEIPALFNLDPSETNFQISKIKNSFEGIDLLDQIQNVFRTLNRVEQEVYLDRNDSWHNMRIIPYICKGSLEGVVITFSDVSKMKKTEISLRKTQQSLATALSLGGCGFWNADLEADSFHSSQIEISQNMHQILGLQESLIPENLEGWLGIVCPDDQIKLHQGLREQVSGKGHRLNLELRIQGSDEIVHWLSEVEVVSRKAGEKRSISCFIQNITQQKHSQKTKAELSSIVTSSQNVIFRVSSDGKIKSWNQGATRLFGYTESEAIDLYLETILPPAIQEALAYAYLTTTKEAVAAIETEAIRKDGNLLSIILTQSPIRDEQGDLVGISIEAQDISEIRKTRSQLQESLRNADEEKAMLSAVMDSISDGLMVYDMVANQPIIFNPATLRLFSFQNKLEANQCIELLKQGPFGYRLKNLDGQEVGYNSWPIARCLRGEEFQNLEFIIEQEGSNASWIGLFSGSLVKNKTGDATRYYVITIRDVSVLRQFEQQERQMFLANAQLGSVLESSESAIKMVDQEGIITSWNEGAFKMYGYTAEEAIGQHISLIMPNEVLNEYDKLTKSGDLKAITAIETVRRTKEGKNITVLLSISPIVDPKGGFYGYSSVSQDISIYKENQDRLLQAKQELESASATKNVFLANVSHEVRTPLAAITGFTDFLSEKLNAVEQGITTPSEYIAESKKHLSRIQSNSEELETIISDLLDVSKIEAGKLEISHGSFDLKNLIDDLASSYASKARKKNLKFEYHCDQNVPKVLRSDRTRVKQVLNNLLSNAVKYTHSGLVSLVISCVPDQSSDKGQINFLVRDTGRGISQKIQGILFRPFERGNLEVSRKIAGNGIGLFLSKYIAQALGGDVTIRSSIQGKGTAMLFTCPVSNSCHNESYSVTQLDQESALDGLKILIVEDNEDLQALGSNYITYAGAFVDIAENGLKAIEKSFHCDYDIVLMDLQMPVMDGYEATKILKSNGNFFGKIIAVTAHAMKGEREKCLEIGFDDYLPKPLKRNQLIAKILKVSRTNDQII